MESNLPPPPLVAGQVDLGVPGEMEEAMKDAICLIGMLVCTTFLSAAAFVALTVGATGICALIAFVCVGLAYIGTWTFPMIYFLRDRRFQ